MIDGRNCHLRITRRRQQLHLDYIICQITPFGKRLFIYFLHFRNLLPGFHKHKVHASEPGQPFPIVLQKYRKIKRTIRSKYKILRKTAIDCLLQNIFVFFKAALHTIPYKQMADYIYKTFFLITKNMKHIIRHFVLAFSTILSISVTTAQSFKAEDIRIANPAAGIELAGTLTSPVEGAPKAVIVLATGSGAQNRDEEIMGHKPFESHC